MKIIRVHAKMETLKKKRFCLIEAGVQYSMKISELNFIFYTVIQ